MRVFATGTYTIGTTEWSLTNNSAVIAAQTAKGRVTVVLDTSAAIGTNAYDFVYYEKCTPDSAQLIADTGSVNQSSALFIGDDHKLGNGWDCTIAMQAGGTPAPIIWTIWIDDTVELTDSDATKQVIAKSLKDQDVTGTISISGSIHEPIALIPKIFASGIFLTNISFAGAGSNYIDVTEGSGIANFYAGCLLIVSGTSGYNEARLITSSGTVGDNLRLTVSESFSETPNIGATYYVLSLGRTQVMNKVDLVDAPNTTAIQAFYDLLTSAKTWTTGSFGRLIVDNLNAPISGVAAAVWAVVKSTLTGPTTIGYWLANLLNLSKTDIANSLKDQNVSATPLGTGSVAKLLDDDVVARPTNPLLTNDSRIPATVIAAKGDLPVAPENTKIIELWQDAALDSSKPVVATKATGAIVTGSIEKDVVDTPTSTTITRKP